MPEQFDIIVIGGGCNGTGIARDCAMRGLKVLLIEKNDFSAGTTGASSGMIHGGPKYLMSDVKTTKLSSQDAGYIRKIAPHLCFRTPFLYPEVRDDALWKKKIRLLLVDAYFQAYDRFSELKGGKKHLRLTREETLNLEPGISPDVVGSVTFDEWGIQTDRLCIANALAAHEYGAIIKNHTEVKKIRREGETVIGLIAHDRRTDELLEYRAQIVFNATGPWVPQICDMAGVKIRLRPAKGIHLILDRRISNVAVVSKCIDGREIFFNPHDNRTLIGTTDDDYYGDLDNIPVTEDEVEYLLQGMEQSYPEIRKARIVSTTRGVRPTLFGYGKSEDSLSREHKIFDHEKEDGLKGFLSMAGGKLAAYRQMSEEASDLVCKKLGRHSRCTTHEVPLPGGDTIPLPQEVAKKFDLHPYIAERIISRQGSHVETVLQSVSEKPEEKAVLCPCEPVTVCEIRHAIREEWACTLGDLKRRTRFGMGSCQGAQCLLPALAILEEENAGLSWLDQRGPLDELRSFLEESWKARSPVLNGVQVAEEEILQIVYQGVFGLGVMK
ncbi:MAG: glycerol-3-phosphate dehydrogenase/oxidase [Deltaproteobacteria bacterium]|nr:glycerol-3-phosphate dehydrogenase/oxidase [Deltaproteobacteria bacterium]